MQQTAVPVAEQGREAARAASPASFAPQPETQKIEENLPMAAASSPEAEALRQEIIRVGRKLWERQYVDGNGGNISVRLGSHYVLCTPTMLSKGDLEPADICLSDLDGNILAGDRSRTSELLLHLEIYKANPRGPGRGALPPALCHSLCRHRHHAAQRADYRVRDLHRPG